MVLYFDNHFAINLAHNPIHQARSKQILAKHHFIRDRVHQGREIEIRKVDTRTIEAHMLTKNANVAVVWRNKNLLGMARYNFVDEDVKFLTISIRGMCWFYNAKCDVLRVVCCCAYADRPTR